MNEISQEKAHNSKVMGNNVPTVQVLSVSEVLRGVEGNGSRRNQKRNQERSERISDNGDGTASIRLSMGQIAIIDAADIPLVAPFVWSAQKRGGYGFYAKANINGRVVYLHRHLMQPKDGEVVDHINWERLDNRRANLRVCSHSVNCANRNPKYIRGSVKRMDDQYRGKPWRVLVCRRHIGMFETEESAREALRVSLEAERVRRTLTQEAEK